jgi:hypothetical protein
MEGKWKVGTGMKRGGKGRRMEWRDKERNRKGTNKQTKINK